MTAWADPALLAPDVAAAQVVAPDCIDCTRDTDGDGVVDASDQCGQSGTGAPVTMRGCAHDSDGDGLHDHRDRCPDTAGDGRIDAHGCPIGSEIDLPEVVFPKNGTTLNRRATRALDDLIDTLTKHPDLRVEIAGYTDSRGRTDKNQQLSQRRAEAVRRYIVSQGIAAGRVRATGYGPADPIADNDSDWGRARNRRVVVKVLNP